MENEILELIQSLPEEQQEMLYLMLKALVTEWQQGA